MRDVSVQADEVMLQFGWYASQSAGQEHEVVHRMADEIVRLRSLIERGANAWLDLQRDHPIPWEGGLDDAMIAACAAIRSLKSANSTFAREAIFGSESLPPAAAGREVTALREVIEWALGERDEFPERPERVEGKPHPLYWWRTEMRQRYELALAAERGREG